MYRNRLRLMATSRISCMINRRTVSLTLERTPYGNVSKWDSDFLLRELWREQSESPINRIEWDLVRILGKKIRFQQASNTYLGGEGDGVQMVNRIM
ncbi:hypothetical protein CEXT_175521 [Caerostris extrusa]|uniref:Uncharacterized protein n=1 Tax=Caerostris extrusa TaxID=172846 RepID=A0AAV4TYG1_CAEEX|nr:hypothetical protein CEXT_175521 [Caerostris extrusa]